MNVSQAIVTLGLRLDGRVPKRSFYAEYRSDECAECHEAVAVAKGSEGRVVCYECAEQLGPTERLFGAALEHAAGSRS